MATTSTVLTTKRTEAVTITASITSLERNVWRPAFFTVTAETVDGAKVRVDLPVELAPQYTVGVPLTVTLR